jgi:hypothetical protein
MALTKTLQTLIERAERTGRAVKRVREANVMGNLSSWGMTREEQRRYIKSSPLIEQWAVTVERTKQDGIQYMNIFVDHYGTEIAHIIVDETRGTPELYKYYGESNSDRDALNGLCSHYGIERGFRYRPSIGQFEEVKKQTEDIGQVQREMAEHAQRKIREEAPWILS